MIQEVGFVSDIASVHSEDTDVHEASTPYDNDMMKVYVRVLPHTSGVPVLTVEASVNARKSLGGTAPSNVVRAVAEARRRFLGKAGGR